MQADSSNAAGTAGTEKVEIGHENKHKTDPSIQRKFSSCDGVSHMNNMGLVFDIKRFSIHDGPGIRTTVFLKGCPLCCAWCHNPESISPEPEEIFHPSRCIKCGKCSQGCFSGARETVGQWMSASELFLEIQKDLPFFSGSGGGVTFSGGEPLLQSAFLRETLSLCVSSGISTAVDTSGHSPWENFRNIIELCGLFLFDVKHVDPVKHAEFTGVDNRLILSNLSSVISSGCDVIVRVPVARGFNDDPESMKEIVSFLAGLEGLKGIEPVKCHGYASAKYRDLGIALGDFVPSDESMDYFRALLASNGLPGGES